MICHLAIIEPSDATDTKILKPDISRCLQFLDKPFSRSTTLKLQTKQLVKYPSNGENISFALPQESGVVERTSLPRQSFLNRL
jgi:hypothetical protein